MPYTDKRERQQAWLKRISLYHELKRQKQGLVRQEEIVRKWHKTGLLGVDSPDCDKTNHVFSEMKKEHERKAQNKSAFTPKRFSGK
jgi:hypothetical protein